MSRPLPGPADILLAKGVSVARYRQLEKARDRAAIVQFVRDRFSQRYIKPLAVPPELKSGFAMMALACLMIEALEAFHMGWARTPKGGGVQAFQRFFNRYSQFGELTPQSRDFYKHIRCGLLHQAETSGGWRIRRRGPLLDKSSRTINATKFLAALEAALLQYCSELSAAPWESDAWKRFRKKMDAVCANALGSQ